MCRLLLLWTLLGFASWPLARTLQTARTRGSTSPSRHFTEHTADLWVHGRSRAPVMGFCANRRPAMVRQQLLSSYNNGVGLKLQQAGSTNKLKICRQLYRYFTESACPNNRIWVNTYTTERSHFKAVSLKCFLRYKLMAIVA